MDYGKLTPRLSIAYDLFAQEGRSSLLPRARLLNMTSLDEVPKPARAVVFLHCAATADLSHLADLGAEVNQESGAVRTAIVEIERLDELSEDPAVRRIASSHYLHPLMDIAPGVIGLPDFQQAFPGLTGDGVVVGVVDSGIDAKHPAFAGRIDRIWDQTLPGPGVPEGGYGAVLTGAGLTTSRDTSGHGTHVAGIAAGAGDRFRGVAPAATLVIVKTDRSDAHIGDGVRYVFRVASEQGLPAVVNLSLGGHFDAHDGTDSLSQVIDEQSGPGQIVCCSAGNEGNDNIHAQVAVAQDRMASIACSVPTGSVVTGSFLLNGWYPGTDELEVAVASPSGFRTPFQPVIADTSPVVGYGLPGGQVQIATPGPDPDNGDHHFLALVEMAPSGPPSALPERPWRLLVRGAQVGGASSQVDVWIMDQTEGLNATFSGRAVGDTMKVGSPGSAASAITVASYTTRAAWDNVDGDQFGVGLEPDTISDFSSEGPCRGGAPKPDLTAPGAMIGSCLSADSAVDRGSMLDLRHVVKGGTSMAAPLVSGIVALLLQQQPDRTPADVKQLLLQHSAIPGQAPGTFDPKWGFGLIALGGLRP